MNSFQKNILAIIKSGFTGDEVTIDEKFPWDRAVAFARKQYIDVMLWMGVQKSGVNIPLECRNALQSRAMMMIANSVRQETEVRIIFDMLKQSNIEFLPLKG